MRIEEQVRGIVEEAINNGNKHANYISLPTDGTTRATAHPETQSKYSSVELYKWMLKQRRGSSSNTTCDINY